MWPDGHETWKEVFKMTEDNKLAKREKHEVTETEQVYMPAVDISEDNNTIRLLADMPGTDQKSVDVKVENGVLSVEGKGIAEPVEGYELVGQEYALGKFRRDFTLSDQVDIEGIKAKVKNGVLEVVIPKQETVKTRKIEITS
jgi:HSP20 family molecular chaperone IbpA